MQEIDYTFDVQNHGTQHFNWDANGNLISHRTQFPVNNRRDLCWDEENRLMAVGDDNYTSYYIYDNSGERTYKLTGLNTLMNINGRWVNFATMENPTLYTGAYLVAGIQGYTKHYYAGSERVSSAIGLGGLENINDPLPIEFGGSWDEKSGSLMEEMNRTIVECLKNDYNIATSLQFLHDMTSPTAGTMDRYFYHPDHLGSSSVSTPLNNHWITDGSEQAIQHLHYLPLKSYAFFPPGRSVKKIYFLYTHCLRRFGENWVDQRTTSWNAPYTFSGKEKDVETGYGYFGARYYNSGLSIWLSVDPMSDKYPSMSPYNYCEYNPVIYIDPNGKEKINALDPSTNAHAYKGIRHYTRNIGVVHLWAHGNENAMLFYNKSHKSNHMITTSNQVHNYLLENSVIYRNNNKEGEESKTTLLVLHSCKTGVQDGIAQKVSNELNVLVIAPTDILSQRSKADGSSVSESVDNNGEWSIYYKGQLMETFNGDTKPLFDNSQKTIEKYEKMYQEKYGNENNSK